MNSHIEQFTEYMRSNGCDPEEPLIDDGILHAHVRDRQDRPGKKDLWYILHGDDIPAGSFGHYSRLQDGINWQAKADNTLTTEQREQANKRRKEAQIERDKALQEVRAVCRTKAAKMLGSAHDAKADHPYPLKKNNKPYGAKQLRDMLLIPLYKSKILVGLQIIMSDGSKKFLTGTEKAGAYFVIKGNGKTVYLVEGWATGCTVHELTGATVIICFDCGNLLEVGKTIRAAGSNDYDMIFVADNDRLKVGNPGITKATEAAMATGARLAIPTFPGDDGDDVNDLYAISGKDAVISCLQSAAMVEPIPTHAPDTDVVTEAPCFHLKSGRDLRALDIKIEWLIDGIIPRGAVILLYGRGGIGKTTLMMILADAIDRGVSVFGMDTVKTQVIVVDFENSLAVLSERAKRTAVEGVLFWDSGGNPPSLDKADWTAYQELLKLYPGAVFVFDTLRSAHSGDENNSEVMTLIMRRMRQLRDAGATVVLLHHTPKGNDRQFKGSGAIFDLCDQTLALYQTAKAGSEQEADDEDDAPDKVYRFGTGKKTRYRPHRVFLSFDTEQEVFTLAKNPDDEAMEYLHSIISRISISSCAKQCETIKAANDDGGFDFGGDKKIRALLKRGIGRFWTTDRGLQNSIIYRPIPFGSLADPIGGEKLPNWNCIPGQFGNTPEKQSNNKDLQSTTVVEFGSLSGDVLDLSQTDFEVLT